MISGRISESSQDKNDWCITSNQYNIYQYVTCSSDRASNPESTNLDFCLQNLLFVMNCLKWIFVLKSKYSKHLFNDRLFLSKNICCSLKISRLLFLKKKNMIHSARIECLISWTSWFILSGSKKIRDMVAKC